LVQLIQTVKRVAKKEFMKRYPNRSWLACFHPLKR